MTTRVEAYRQHCARMATAQHKPECPWSRPEQCKPKPRWGFLYGVGSDTPTALAHLGFTEPPLKCDGCVSDVDRELFARLSAEAADYVQGNLLEDA